MGADLHVSDMFSKEVLPLRHVLGFAIATAESSAERERFLEGRMRFVSRIIWPWNDSLLVPLAALLAALDLLSTYVLLELSGNVHVYESGLLASWALQRGGFNGLYIMNAAAVGMLCLIAVSARLFYGRFGLEGFARTAYVAVLVPYVLVAFAAVVGHVP